MVLARRTFAPRMVRFLVNLLMIPGVLLTQLAAVPHAHAFDASEATHEGHPHFHFHLSFGNPARESVEVRACSSIACSTPIVSESAPPADHDADAVYVETTTASPDREKPLFAAFQLSSCPLFVVPAVANHCSTSRQRAERSRRLSSCPLYVQFRALTI